MAKRMTIDLVEFEMSHIDQMDIRGIELEGPFELDDIRERIGRAAELCVRCGTFMAGDEIICCTGFHILWPGVAEGWILPSKHVEKHARQFSREIKAWIELIMKEYNCHRFQANTADDINHRRWMKFLGFQEEGIMRNFTHDKKNIVMYSRLSDGC